MGGGGKELGLLVAVAALTELIFGPVWGSLSDRVGRKPILMLGMVGYGLSSLLFGLATELWMLYAARALSGVLSAATASTAMAYIGDSTSDEIAAAGWASWARRGDWASSWGRALAAGWGASRWRRPSLPPPGISLRLHAADLLLLPESLPRRGPPAGRGQDQDRCDLGELWRALFSPIGILLFMAFLVQLWAGEL